MNANSSGANIPGYRILIACIGNIFFGDDGFGVEVARRLLSRQTGRYPANVQVIDFGIRGRELAYMLLDPYDTLMLVDTVSRGGPAGTLYLIEPELRSAPEQSTAGESIALDGHSMDPVKVLTLARILGAPPIHTLLVGCEPAVIDAEESGEEMHIGLSEPVQATVDEAVKMIDMLVEELLAASV